MIRSLRVLFVLGWMLILYPCVALFAATEKGNWYLRVGQRGIVCEILAEPCFVETADMTGGEVAIYPASVAGSGLRELRLVPVTRASADRNAKVTARPPTPLRGVADWCDNFHTAGGGLVDRDIFEGRPELAFAQGVGHADAGLFVLAGQGGHQVPFGLSMTAVKAKRFLIVATQEP